MGIPDRDFQYIVVDGASTDGSREILAATHGIDWTSEPDGGIYEALNKGIAKATGQYVLFINSGDLIAEPATIAKTRPHLGSRRHRLREHEDQKPGGELGWRYAGCD